MYSIVKCFGKKLENLFSQPFGIKITIILSSSPYTFLKNGPKLF